MTQVKVCDEHESGTWNGTLEASLRRTDQIVENLCHREADELAQGNQTLRFIREFLTRVADRLE